MSKEDRQTERLEHAGIGGHLGGTKFGQQPGTAEANHAQPPNQVDNSKNDKKKND
ncbi:hypothetical protein [Pelagibacterium sp.]|uniref:hypothetical protein n=1 Tax=Pelagibacterium sp. TaxID=1967288 RepID=UPI003A9155C0